jgi:hypothetical protein
MLEWTKKIARTTVQVPIAVNDQTATTDALIEPRIEEAAGTPIADGPALDDAALENPPPALMPTLEDRVRQLEDQVAGLRDSRKLEDRLTERVARRLERKQASTAIKVPLATVAEPTKPPPMAAIAPPPDLPPVVVIEGKSAKQPWLILDIVTEFKAMLQMFLDVRYRVFYMNWQTKAYPLLLLGLIVVSGLTISYIPIVGPVLDRIVELVIAFLLYKVLSREAHRYKEIGPQIRR